MSEKEIKDIFTTRLKELLIKNNMTYRQLGDKLNIKPSAISMWNSGRSLPRIEVIEKIAECFNVSPAYLMGWDPMSDEAIGEVFYNSMKDEPKMKRTNSTIAAHFNGDEYTEEELEEIKQFVEFVKSKRKDK